MFGEHLADNVLKCMSELNRYMNPSMTETNLSAVFSKQIKDLCKLGSGVNMDELSSNLEDLLHELRENQECK